MNAIGHLNRLPENVSIPWDSLLADEAMGLRILAEERMKYEEQHPRS